MNLKELMDCIRTSQAVSITIDGEGYLGNLTYKEVFELGDRKVLYVWAEDDELCMVIEGGSKNE